MKTLNVGMIGAGFMGKAHSLAYTAMPIIECYDLFKAIVDGTSASPDFRDGYQIARIEAANQDSSADTVRVDVPPLEDWA